MQILPLVLVYFVAWVMGMVLLSLLRLSRRIEDDRHRKRVWQKILTEFPGMPDREKVALLRMTVGDTSSHCKDFAILCSIWNKDIAAFAYGCQI